MRASGLATVRREQSATGDEKSGFLLRAEGMEIVLESQQAILRHPKTKPSATTLRVTKGYVRMAGRKALRSGLEPE